MKVLARTAELRAAEAVIIEVMRITKLSNPQALIGVDEDDVDYLIKNIARDYLAEDFQRGQMILKAAVTQFFSLSQKESKINLGDFTRLCHAEDRRQKEFQQTQQLISPDRPLSPKNHGRENFEKLKKMLGESEAIKRLPYNKDFRVQSDNYERVEEPIKKENEITFCGPVLEHFCYSDGPRLYEKCSIVGHIEPMESIKNVELRDLYERAWTIGLMNDEKARFYELTQRGAS